MTEFAVLVPTRSRPANIAPIVEAWHQTGAFGVADLIFVVDEDDMAYPEYAALLLDHPQVRRINMPEWKPLVPKLNEAAALVSQRYPTVAFMGDDHLPRTGMWAHTLILHHATTPGSIWYGRDGFQDQRLASWWSMDSGIIRKLGGRMVPAPVQHMYCDNAVMALGEQAGVLNYDPSILVEHMHPFAGKSAMDAQYERDGVAFRTWIASGLEADARLLTSTGG